MAGERQLFDLPRDWAALFEIDPSHSLSVVGHARHEREDSLDETRWLLEHDASARLVARYRAWLRRASCPPYRRQLGWERFSVAGELLDREVRHWTRADEPSRH